MLNAISRPERLPDGLRAAVRAYAGPEEVDSRQPWS